MDVLDSWVYSWVVYLYCPYLWCEYLSYRFYVSHPNYSSIYNFFFRIIIFIQGARDKCALLVWSWWWSYILKGNGIAYLASWNFHYSIGGHVQTTLAANGPLSWVYAKGLIAAEQISRDMSCGTFRFFLVFLALFCIFGDLVPIIPMHF